MKVILLENLAKIGSIGEVIDVKRGFARNYLISNKKALYASKENIKGVEKIKAEVKKKDQDKKKIDVKPSLIQPLNEIKTLGTFKVKINLHSDVQAEIKIKVVSEDNIK